MDKPYMAKVKLRVNWGKLTVEPGQVVYLGDDDTDVNIPSLLRLGAIVPYEEKKEEPIIETTEEEGIVVPDIESKPPKSRK